MIYIFKFIEPLSQFLDVNFIFLALFFQAASKSPIKICVSGGAGQIAYSLLLEIATGKVFGSDQAS